jgi:hypothetical protein
MTKLTKLFLALSLVGFAIGGVIDFSSAPLDPKWTVLMPLGAVFFGLFLVSLMLEKEMAAFNREETEKLQLVRQEAPASARQPSHSGGQRTTQLKESTL